MKDVIMCDCDLCICRDVIEQPPVKPSKPKPKTFWSAIWGN